MIASSDWLGISAEFTCWAIVCIEHICTSLLRSGTIKPWSRSNSGSNFHRPCLLQVLTHVLSQCSFAWKFENKFRDSLTWVAINKSSRTLGSWSTMTSQRKPAKGWHICSVQAPPVTLLGHCVSSDELCFTCTLEFKSNFLSCKLMTHWQVLTISPCGTKTAAKLLQLALQVRFDEIWVMHAFQTWHWLSVRMESEWEVGTCLCSRHCQTSRQQTDTGALRCQRQMMHGLGETQSKQTEPDWGKVICGDKLETQFDTQMLSWQGYQLLCHVESLDKQNCTTSCVTVTLQSMIFWFPFTLETRSWWPNYANCFTHAFWYHWFLTGPLVFQYHAQDLTIDEGFDFHHFEQIIR